MRERCSNNKYIPVVLLLALILLVYSNTFHAAWHLDDVTNILDNKNVHVTTWSVEAWVRSVSPPFSNPGSTKLTLYRPVVMLTFALNWYFGKADVYGYHIVNIGIHCFTSLLLFFTILNLLDTPNIRKRYQGKEYFIALLATVFWALHPIHTQAVTYIVQRMTSLAALFYLFGIYFYVKGRSGHVPGKSGLFYGLCLTSYILALGSKQNTATLPVAWLLIEVIFFTDPKFYMQTKGRWIASGIIVALFVFFFLLFYLWLGDPVSAILKGYQNRPFSLAERILTEFRVMIFYLKQLFYPIPQQFSILHDIELSKSLLDPWTTLAAILSIGSLIIFAVAIAYRIPLLSFAILFFFLGHSVESTIFPLELVFEHRNYLPTFFLFLPLASGLCFMLERYRRQNLIVYCFLLVFVPLVITGLGVGAYTRNMAWASQKSLWQDAMQKAPLYARPYQNVAMALEKEGRLDGALQLYRTSLDRKDPDPRLARFISLSNMGNIFKRKHDYANAVQYLTAAIKSESGPYALRVHYNLVLCLLNNHQEKEAFEHLNRILDKQKDNSRFMTIKGFMLLRQKRIDPALHSLRSALKRNPYDKDVLLSLAMALSAKGAFERAEWYLKQAKERYPNNLVIYLCLLQNAIAMQDSSRINPYLFQITSVFRIDDIKQFFAEHAKGHHYINNTLVPVEDQIIIPYLAENLIERARKFGDGTKKEQQP